MHLGVDVRHDRLPHDASRKKNENVDQEITQDEQRNSRACEYACTEGYSPHDGRKRLFIHIVSDF
jgi:hypothetical protein